MARMSLQEVTSSAAALFPDNTTKQITPARMRQFISELIGAIRPAYGYLSRSANVVQALTTTPSPLVMDTGSVSPIVDYTLTPALARIQRNEKGVTNFTFTCDVLGSSNTTRQVTFTLFRNGVATAWRQTVTLTTSTITEGVSFPAIEYLNGIAQYQLMVSCDAAYSVTFSNVVFVAETIPVWDFV